MKKTFKSVSLAVVFSSSLLATGIASASYIETSASATGSGTGGEAFTDEGYSYNFQINDGSDSLATTFSAILTNTSVNSAAKIDVLAFNINSGLTLGTDLSTPGTGFTITNVVPDWTFAVSGTSVAFDYIGTPDNQDQKLAQGTTLAFDFTFSVDQTFDLWLESEENLGRGIGGGEDLGQVAVSFQTLGEDGDDSDLLASNWTVGIGGGSTVPEPSPLALLGLGALLLRWSSRKSKA